jgi:hypothetical protein
MMKFIDKYYKNIFVDNLHLLVLLLIVLLAFFLRYPGVERDSLWLDEAWRLQLFQVPLDFSNTKILISQLLGFDGLIRLIVYLFESNEWTLRAVSFYSGVLAVPSIYILGYHVSRKTFQPLIVAFLLAINPWHIAYSSELAPYALGSFLFTVFLYTLIRLHENNNYLALFMSALVGGILSLMHLYFFGLVLICILILLLLNMSRTSIINKLLILLVIVVMFNLFEVISYFAWVDTDRVSLRYNINWIVGFPLKVLNAVTSGPIPNRYVSTVSNFPFWYILFFYSVIVTTSLLFIRSFIHTLKVNNKPTLLFIYSTLLYILFIYFQGIIQNGAFLRYLIPILPVLLLIVIESILQFSATKPKYSTLTAFIFCFFTLNYSLAIYNESPGEKFKPKYRDFFASFVFECSENKVFFLNPNFTEIPILNFYLKDTDCNVFEQPAFEAYFKEGELSLLNKDEAIYKKQDKWMAKEIVKLIDKKAIIYVVSLRNQIRTYNMVKSTNLLFDKIINKQIPDLLILKLN